MAQCLETGIIWATRPTQGWAPMENEALLMAGIVKEDIKAIRKAAQ